MNNFEKSINDITISIDYKVELIGLLITLSNEKELYPSKFNFNETNDSYIRELEETFSYIRNHKTVQKFFYLKEKYYLHYEKPIELALSLDDNFEFKDESNYKFKDNEEIKLFCKELKELCEEINFQNFYETHKETYMSWIETISPTYSEYNAKEAIISYCGEQYKDYKFYTNLIPFETNGGYGILLKGEAHNCLRARRKAKDNNLFYIENSTTYLFTSIHEYLHSIINPITTKYNIFNYETDYLYDKKNPLPGYGNDYCMINETIIRAMTIRIFNILTGINKDEEELDADESYGFKYIRIVYYKLKEYENNRNKYVDIEMFYVEIANAIIDENKKSKK